MLWPSWDRQLFFWINGVDSTVLTAFMRFITNVDNWIPFLAAGIFLLLWMGRTRPNRQGRGRWGRAFAGRNPRIVILCLILATAASDQACYHIKRWSGRQRPCFDESISGMVDYRGDVHGNRSFPSAHASNSAALAATVSFAYPPLVPFAAALAFLVGLSRIYLGVHYPLDVITGWSIGTASALLVWLLLRKYSLRPGLIGFTNRFRYRQPAPYERPSDPWTVRSLVSLDGYSVHGYLRPGGKELVVMVHGLNGDVNAMVPPGNIFGELGCSVLIVQLRGHDGHPVPVTSGGPEEAYDLAGAIMEAVAGMGFARSSIILYGSSMGGAVAMKVAGLLGEGVAGVIVHGTFSNFFESSDMRLGVIRTRIMKLFMPAGVRNGLEVFRPGDYPGRWQRTRFVYITGERDSISPPEVSEELSGLTGGRVILLDGAGHPVWHSRSWSAIQIRSAFTEALGFIRGESSGNIIVDAAGRASAEFDVNSATGRGK